jgi:hypothetical protein
VKLSAGTVEDAPLGGRKLREPRVPGHQVKTGIPQLTEIRTRPERAPSGKQAKKISVTNEDDLQL